MQELKENMQAPEFSLAISPDKNVRLSDFKGKNLVLYFYPKDDTPGCTTEAKDFSQNYKKLQSLNCEVLGVSKDDLKKHEKFKEKCDLSIPLASDIDGKASDAYGVWKQKSFLGKKYMGIERSTFLIDANGKIAKIWRNVKVNGHVEDILKNLAK
jgi:peroxiredoxin Q/BCP